MLKLNLGISCSCFNIRLALGLLVPSRSAILACVIGTALFE
ncbi:hypothetical protein OCA08_21670 [Bacillus cereus]|nr:hypothetical protein [Bacillus cereus]